MAKSAHSAPQLKASLETAEVRKVAWVAGRPGSRISRGFQNIIDILAIAAAN